LNIELVECMSKPSKGPPYGKNGSPFATSGLVITHVRPTYLEPGMGTRYVRSGDLVIEELG
jgi:hypothetical protein